MRNAFLWLAIFVLAGGTVLAIGTLDGDTDPPMPDEDPLGTPPPGIFDPSYASAMSFPQASCLIAASINLAFDGTNFWSCSGGGPGGQRLAQYDAAGNEITCYAPGIDFRTVFTDGGNSSPVFARSYNSNDILEQTSPGVFSTSVVLSGGPLTGVQEGAVFNTGATEIVTLSDTSIGEVKRYDAVTGN